MRLNEPLLAAWKFCLSFRKNDWELDDYPIVTREMKMNPEVEQLTAHLGTPERYLARIVNWWVLTGGGSTPEEAKADLIRRFEERKADCRSQKRPLPRPGARVPLEFAPSDRLDVHPDLKADFIKRVLGVEWVFISDESSIWDFQTDETAQKLCSKIMDEYGVDVSDIESGNIAQILDRIAARLN